MEPNRSYDTGPKGRYYRLDIKEGHAVLEPVKTPEHVKKKREENIRRRELVRSVEQNRARALHLDARKTIWLSACLAICCIVAAVYLHAWSEINATRDRISSLQTQIENVSASNDLLESRLYSDINLFEIKQKAQELGMVSQTSDQIRYYSVKDKNYMVRYGK